MLARYLAAVGVAIVGALLITLLAQVTMRVIPWLRTKGVPEVVLTCLRTLAEITKQVVGATQQTVVADLKNPQKPGSWNEVTQDSTKRAVVREVHYLGGTLEAQLRAQGWEQTQIDKYIEHVLEATVLEMKQRETKKPDAAVSIKAETAPVTVNAAPEAPTEGP